jgi:protein involved in polysaccharide export with SLBB domain
MKTETNNLVHPRPARSRRTPDFIPVAIFEATPLWALLLLLAVGRLFASDTSMLDSPDATQLPTDSLTRTAVKPSSATSNAAPVDLGNAMNVLDDKHKLAIGDQISFRIVEDEDDPKSLTVMDSGELEIPYLGRFQSVGKTCKQLAGVLKTELEKEYYKQATVVIAVNLMAKSRGKVYLVGPVHVPGPQEIPSDEVLTLSKAILRAGGFTDFADQKTVKVTRQSKVAGGKDESFVINVGKVLEQGATESDLPLEPGDLIFVREKLVRF